MKSRDAEALSAYLDGQLSPAESKQLEERLRLDSGLEELLADLRFARAALKRMPRRALPRNFVLRPSMPEVRGPVPRSVPALRLASLLAALLLVATFAINGLTTRAQTTPMAAPFPAYGLGGAGGAAASPEALLQSNAAEAPAEGQDMSATASPERSMAPTAGPGVEEIPKAAPPAAPGNLPPAAPRGVIPAFWQLLLAAIAVVLGGLAWHAYRTSRRNFTSKYIEK
jgi:hypothetical protein